jgi:hypothetical protein
MPMTEDSRPSRPEIWDIPTDPAEPAQPEQPAPAPAQADFVTAYVQHLQPCPPPAPYPEPRARNPKATGQQALFGGAAARACLPPGSEKTILGVAPVPPPPHDGDATVLAPRQRPSEPTVLAPMPPLTARANDATVLAAPVFPPAPVIAPGFPHGAAPSYPMKSAGSVPVGPSLNAPMFRPQPSSYPRAIGRAETEIGARSRRRTVIVLVLLAAMIGLAGALAYVQLAG